jgi:short-subunit dehydrogenase
VSETPAGKTHAALGAASEGAAPREPVVGRRPRSIVVGPAPLEWWLARRRLWRGAPAGAGTPESRLPFAVVAGGSQGIGLAIARRLARQGHRLLLVARGEASLAEAAAELARAGAARVVTLALDLTAEGAARRIEEALAAENAYCDALIVSAGVGLAGPFERHASRDVAGLVALDVAAPTLLLHHFLPGMRARGRGAALLLASLGGFAPGPWQAAYYASRAYLVSLVEAVAHEVRGEGVRVAVLAPGPVRTAFHERMGGERGLYLRLMLPKSADRVARLGLRSLALGRRVIVPGAFDSLVAFAMRVLPRPLIVPIVGFLLRPRRWLPRWRA